MEWTFVGETSLKGINEVRDYMKEAYIEPPRFKIDLMIEEGNYLTAVGTISIVNTDSLWIAYEYCDVWRFENCKLAELKPLLLIDNLFMINYNRIKTSIFVSIIKQPTSDNFYNLRQSQA